MFSNLRSGSGRIGWGFSGRELHKGWGFKTVLVKFHICQTLKCVLSVLCLCHISVPTKLHLVQGAVHPVKCALSELYQKRQ